MTRDEWCDELVRLATEACELAISDVRCEGILSNRLRERLTERMTEAAQRIVAERDTLQEAADSRGYMDGLAEQRDEERERLDRIDATARAMLAVLWEQPVTYRGDLRAVSRSYGYAAYTHAEQFEDARAEWLAKRAAR